MRPAGADGMAVARRRAAPGAGNGTDREPNGDGDAPAPATAEESIDPSILEGLSEEGRRLILEARLLKRKQEQEREAIRLARKRGQVHEADMEAVIKRALWTIVTHPYTRVLMAVMAVLTAVLLTMIKAMVESELTPPYDTEDIAHRRYQGDAPPADVARLHDSLFVADLRAHTLYKGTDIAKRHGDACGYWTCERSHVDVPRLVDGNVGLQVFAAVTDLPYARNAPGPKRNGDLTCGKWAWFCPPNLKLNRDGGTYDMMGLVSALSGWHFSSWFNRFPRAWSMARKMRPFTDGNDRELFLITDKNMLKQYYFAREFCMYFRDMDEPERARNERLLEGVPWHLNKTGGREKGRQFFGAPPFNVKWIKSANKNSTKVSELERKLGDSAERFDVLSRCRFTAGILAIEGAGALEGDEHKLGNLYMEGYRIFAPGHFRDNEATGSLQGKKKLGLSDFGKALIIRSELIGMVLDLAHMSDKALHEALELVTKPFFYSHTGAFGANRNALALPDKDLRAIARKGGVVGVGFYKEATGGTGVEDIVRNIMYVARVAGWEHVALGSGWDGRHAMPAGLDAAGTWRITELLMREGVGEGEIRGVMGDNVLRVLDAAMKAPLKPGDINPDMYKLYEVPEGRTLPGIDMSKIDYVTIYPEITDGDESHTVYPQEEEMIPFEETMVE